MTASPRAAQPEHNGGEPSDAQRVARHAAAALLVSAYQQARDRTITQDVVVSVPDHRAAAGRWRRNRRVYGLRRLVTYALDDHCRRRIAALKRALAADAVAGAPAPPALLQGCDDLIVSLSPLPYRRMAFALVLAVAGVALAVIELLRSIHPVKAALKPVLQHGGDVVSDLAVRVLTLDVTQVPDALGEIGNRNAGEIAFVILLLLLASYVVLRPAVSSFSVKRGLLSASDGQLDSGSAAAHAPTVAGGAYRLERQAFARAPRESPFDLVVFALPMLMPLYVGCFIIVRAAVTGLPADALSGVIFGGLASVRLAHLSKVWRQRLESANQPVAARRPLGDAPERPTMTP